MSDDLNVVIENDSLNIKDSGDELNVSFSEADLKVSVEEDELTVSIEDDELVCSLDVEPLQDEEFVPYVDAVKNIDLNSKNLTTTGTITTDELIATGITLGSVRKTSWDTDSVWGSITGTISNQTDLQNALDAKENSIGYTPENIVNKDTSSTLGTSDIKYPSQYAVKQYADKLIDDLNLEQNEVFTLDATDLSNKYVTITETITDNQSILVIVSDIGLVAEPGVDYSISGQTIYWTGYSFATKLEVGEKLKIYYK